MVAGGSKSKRRGCLERDGLVTQMARAFAGGEAGGSDDDDLRRRADEALTRVESFLGVEIEEAKEIVGKVLEDIP